MEMQALGNGYRGGFSTLTKYGTMNVSATRVPRKARSKGNKVLHPRANTVALTPVTDGEGRIIERLSPKRATGSRLARAEQKLAPATSSRNMATPGRDKALLHKIGTITEGRY